MKSFNAIILFLSVFLISSCIRKNENTIIDVDWQKYPISNLVNPENINVSGLDFLDEQTLYLEDDSFLFCKPTFAKTNELHLYKLKDDTLKWIKEMIRGGAGPWETLGSSDVRRGSAGDVFVGAPSYSPKVFRLSSLADSVLFDKQKWENHKLPSGVANITRILPVVNNQFLVTMAGDFSSFLANYELGDSIFSYIPFPYPDDEYNNISRTMVYDGSIEKHPLKNKFLYCCTAGKYMFVFELKDGEMQNLRYLYDNPPKYNLSKNGTMITSLTNETFLGGKVYVTDRYIYVAMNDFKWEDFIRGTIEDRNGGFPNWFNNKIYVYDWDANPVKSFHLDLYVADFVVDSQDKHIYAITKDVDTDDVTLVKYSMH